MESSFCDMFGNPISIGDIFIIPDGNARYGGLKLYVGIIISQTEKTVSTEVFELPSGKPKGIKRKTPSKLLKIDPNFYINNSDLFLNLQKQSNKIKGL